MIGHATEGSTALDHGDILGILQRSLSVTSRQDPTVAARLHPSSRPVAAPRRRRRRRGAFVAAGGYMYVRSRAVAPASTTQEQSVLTEALLSGKVELARADLDNHAYDDAAAHAQEALAIDPRARRREVLDKAVGRRPRSRRRWPTRRPPTSPRRHVDRIRGARAAAPSTDVTPPLAPPATSAATRRRMRRPAERAATARATAEGRHPRTPAYAQAKKLTVEADGLFAQERFAEAADKYIESRFPTP
ncbi:MAG: hypothetical protein U0599_06750 [Vicinamibacteria bacterium]